MMMKLMESSSSDENENPLQDENDANDRRTSDIPYWNKI